MTYESLPIYQIAFELFVSIAKAVQSFPKDYKYTIGERLQNYTLDNLAEISLASIDTEIQNKIHHIENSKKDTELVKILRRACHEINILSNNTYITQINSLVSLSKQLTGWEIHCKNKTSISIQ